MENDDRVNLPYCLYRQNCGRYLLLNRNYKPIGNPTKEWVDYEPLEGLDLRLSREDAERISWDVRPGTKFIFLFNDGCPPWRGRRNRENYLRRLAIVAGLIEAQCEKQIDGLICNESFAVHSVDAEDIASPSARPKNVVSPTQC
jgi:hypothetical protein